MTCLSYRTPPYSSRRAIPVSPERVLSRCRPVARTASLWAPGRHGLSAHYSYCDGSLPTATASLSESTLGGPNITSVAFYSSQGPTFDNRYLYDMYAFYVAILIRSIMLHRRIKPDLVAPGDSLVSVLSNGAAGPTCGTISKTGTSMATPAAAGVGLLVRQYFMSPSSAFWAGHCNLANSFCRAFTPSGVLVKAVLLQSGSAMNMFDGGGGTDKQTTSLQSHAHSITTSITCNLFYRQQQRHPGSSS